MSKYKQPRISRSKRDGLCDETNKPYRKGQKVAIFYDEQGVRIYGPSSNMFKAIDPKHNAS